MARSSTEVEYKALANTTAKLIWLQSLLWELGLFHPNSPILWCNNIGATYLSTNPMFHARTEHVEIDYHFVREKLAHHDLDVHFISGKDQLANALTKPLSSTGFSFLRSKLNVQPLPLSLRGSIEDISKSKTHASNTRESRLLESSNHTKAGSQSQIRAK